MQISHKPVSTRVARAAAWLGLASLFVAAACGSQSAAADRAADATRLASMPAQPLSQPLTAGDDSSRIRAENVRWVYMSWPIPTDVVSRPLIGGRDTDRVAQLLRRVEDAKPIDGQGLSYPIKGRSMAVNVEFSDGHTLEIRPAWSCSTSKEENGNTSTSCTPVENRVWIGSSDPAGGEYFADSEALFRFVNETYKTWMPSVKPYEAPEQIQAGASFTVVGHGARSDEATVILAKGNDKLWEGKAHVREGEWAVTGTAPAGIASGDGYEWRIRVGTGEYGLTVRVEA